MNKAIRRKLFFRVGVGVGNIPHFVNLSRAADLPKGAQVDAEHGFEHAKENVVRPHGHQASPHRQAVEPSTAKLTACLLCPQVKTC